MSSLERIEPERAATQCDKVLAYMERHGSIDQMAALRDIGVMRLASRISDLKRHGHRINRVMKEVTARDGSTAHVAVYSLEVD